MKCPYCGSDESNVLESRVAADQTSMRRRRVCLACAKRFTTYERVEGNDLTVIKKDGTREPFDREKIRKGLMKATWKRPISVDEIEHLLLRVEQTLLLHEATEIRSWEVGELVITELRKLDPVSYLLFACVYRDFQSLEDFSSEIQDLQRVVRGKARRARTSNRKKQAQASKKGLLQ